MIFDFFFFLSLFSPFLANLLVYSLKNAIFEVKMPKAMIDFENCISYNNLCNNFTTLILKAPWILFSNDSFLAPILNLVLSMYGILVETRCERVNGLTKVYKS